MNWGLTFFGLGVLFLVLLAWYMNRHRADREHLQGLAAQLNTSTNDARTAVNEGLDLLKNRQ